MSYDHKATPLLRTTENITRCNSTRSLFRCQDRGITLEYTAVNVMEFIALNFTHPCRKPTLINHAFGGRNTAQKQVRTQNMRNVVFSNCVTRSFLLVMIPLPIGSDSTKAWLTTPTRSSKGQIHVVSCLQSFVEHNNFTYNKINSPQFKHNFNLKKKILQIIRLFKYHNSSIYFHFQYDKMSDMFLRADEHNIKKTNTNFI